MRTLLLFLTIILSSFSIQQDKVLICQSETAYAYHSHMCRGLKACSHSVEKIDLAVAKRMKRKPCGYCYKTTLVAKETPVSSGQCAARTKKGTQCSRKATSGGYCWQHG